jgi:hypothetical protein
MPGGGEPAHVTAEFGDDHLGRAPRHPGNGVEPGEHRGLRRGEHLEVAVVGGDGVVLPSCVDELEPCRTGAVAQEPGRRARRRLSRGCFPPQKGRSSARERQPAGALTGLQRPGAPSGTATKYPVPKSGSGTG